MKNNKNNGKKLFLLKYTIIGVIISVIIVHFSIDLTFLKVSNSAAVYLIIINFSAVFGGLFGLFLGLLFLKKDEPEEYDIYNIEYDFYSDEQREEERLSFYKWQKGINLFSYLNTVLTLFSFYTFNYPEEDKLFYSLLYIGAYGFWLAFFSFEFYKFQRKIKKKNFKIPAVFKFLFLSFGLSSVLFLIWYILKLS